MGQEERTGVTISTTHHGQWGAPAGSMVQGPPWPPLGLVNLGCKPLPQADTVTGALWHLLKHTTTLSGFSKPVSPQRRPSWVEGAH